MTKVCLETPLLLLVKKKQTFLFSRGIRGVSRIELISLWITMLTLFPYRYYGKQF